MAARAYGGEAPTFGAGLADPQPVRSAPDPAHRAGGREGRDGVRRRDAADRRLRAYTASASTRFVFRSGFIMKPVFAAGQGRAQARHLRRRRGRARAARRPGRGRGGPREADPDRPPGRDRGAARALRPRDPAGPRFRAHQSRGRSALSRLCRGSTSRPPAARASRPTRRAPWCAPTPP